jgi:hypothetical protein
MLPPHRYGKGVLGACLLVGATQGAFVPPAGAVPVPYKNCGKAGDILQVTTLDASVWPPPIAVPLAGTATIDSVTGQLTNLRVRLGLGVDWQFDSGSVPTSLRSGFVPLPASVPMSVTGPDLPVAVGPYNLLQTFRSGPGDSSVTVLSKANVGQSIAAPLTQLSLKFDGAPGFPVPPVPGSYEARVQMTLPSGAEVFCFDLTVTDVAFVTAAPLPVPTLPGHGMSALLLLVAGIGLLALRRR